MNQTKLKAILHSYLRAAFAAAMALYLDEMFDLKNKLPGFHYFPTFSREENVADGHCIGYVHSIYEQLLDDKNAEAQFYLCGWRDMINDARQRLQARGFDKKDIHFELYG
jgi:CDP-4-dehydro-6-deoxyglucose reductase